MAVQLAISSDNKTHTLTSGTSGDILSTYLDNTHPSTTRHITIELIRNCCTSGKVTINLPPRYSFGTQLVTDNPYTPGTPTANNRVANFRLTGIDVSYIKKFEVQTNADNPTTNTFAFKEYPAATVTGTGAGYPVYYLLNGSTATYQARITTIDDYVYVINQTYDWRNALTPATIQNTTTVATAIATQATLPTQPTIDFTANTIKFDPADWGLNVSDGVFLDGVYQYNLTQVETGADKTESVHKFFNIKLKCLVTTYLAGKPTDAITGMMMSALEVADTCNLSVAQKCALYNRIIRKLLLNNQIKAASPLGCNCGCK